MLFPSVLVMYQEEMKGQQDREGKRFSFSRCLERQRNAGENKARLNREQGRAGRGKSWEREVSLWEISGGGEEARATPKPAQHE